SRQKPSELSAKMGPQGKRELGGQNILDSSETEEDTFLCRDRDFRLFVVAVCSLLRYKGIGPCRCLRHFHGPNQVHLWSRQTWLEESLLVPVPAKQTEAKCCISPRSKARSWSRSKSILTLMQSWSCFRTRPRFHSILTRCWWSSLSYRIG